MIRLENILNISLQEVLKTSWRRLEDVFKTSWRRLEDVLKTFLQDVLKTSGQAVLKMSWRHLGNALKTSWRRVAKMNILVLTKTSWRRLEDKDERRLNQDECLVGSDLFHMFTRSIDFYYILLSLIKEYRCLKNVFHQIDRNEWLFLSAFQQSLWKFLKLVFVLDSIH